MKNLGAVLSTIFTLLSLLGSTAAHADPVADRQLLSPRELYDALGCNEPIGPTANGYVPEDYDHDEAFVRSCKSMAEASLVGEHQEFKPSNRHDKRIYIARKHVKSTIVLGGDPQPGAGGISLGGENTCPANSSLPGCGY